MSVSIVPALQSKRQNYVNKKNNARNQITRCERAYESLSNFKTTVSQAQEDFHLCTSCFALPRTARCKYIYYING